MLMGVPDVKDGSGGRFVRQPQERAFFLAQEAAVGLVRDSRSG